MKPNSYSQKLHRTLKQLEELAQKIVETRGYSSESKKVRALQELIKEQIIHEDTGHSTRQTR